ncbi:MAG: ribulose-phosphate 3-epimerase [Nanoarchaeota archaeon]|nr:ribulose-phosphate 3-epimerase [Nanoarchaeota archaeon]
MKTEIIPAIIATNQEELDERIEKVSGHAEKVQLDIMDGKFVQNTSLYFDFKLPQGPVYEAHLMVEQPEEWIEQNWEKADVFIFHYESCKDARAAISLIKSKGKKAGLAINPETPVEEIEQYLSELDQVLVMTVNPGFYGSPFLPETLDKVRQLRKLNPEMDIEVDGGIALETAKDAYEAGANLLVCGSYIQKSDSPGNAIKYLKGLTGG